MINHFKYPFHAGTDRETNPSHQYQEGQSKWNTEPASAHLPASDSSYPSWNQVRKHELHTSFPSKRQGTNRSLCQQEGTQSESAWAMGQTLPSCPSTPNSNQPPLQPDLWQYRDKGPSTNKAVTSALLFCCPNEPTGPGACAAAIWDIQSRKNPISKPCSCLGYKQTSPLQSCRHLPVLLAWNLQASVARKWPYQILMGPWGRNNWRERSCCGKQQVGVRQHCKQNMGIKGVSCEEFWWRRCKMSELKD